MKEILKMVLVARKNFDKEYYKDFKAFSILSWNDDYSWLTEENKCEKVREIIEMPSTITEKEIKKIFKERTMEIAFYKEHKEKAINIIKQYKEH